MADGKPHLNISAYQTSEDFQSKRTGRSPVTPQQDRTFHGQQLTAKYNQILQDHAQRKAKQANPITEELGIYVEIESIAGCELPLDSLDNRDFELRSCRKDGSREFALIFIPESKRDSFLKKIQHYLDPQKDGAAGPRNHNLIDAIANIKLADLKSFWTDDLGLFPADEHQDIWWELWLKKGSGDASAVAKQLAERVNGQLSNTSLSFFDSFVVLIKSSANNLAKAPELIANLEELRYAKETPTILVEASPKEQHQWANQLIQRISLSEDTNTVVCILDTGINYNHPLLEAAFRADFAEAWNPNWPDYDEYDPTKPYQDHGSKQAGLALFGDLQEVLFSNEEISLSHTIESGRIIPPTGKNDPELYGHITVGTAAKLYIERPELNRVYSLAITASNYNQEGIPSSWSSEIDRYTCGVEDDVPKLFVISAGNNSEIRPDIDYWDQVHLAQIEDPAQSWNALTVGAYTEKTTNDDQSFSGWAPLAKSGDVSPASRSSIHWSWRKQAPFKPDIVAEGGNRLISPNHTEVSNADVVSLLTTSGRASNQLFETVADTSAATALVSQQAARLMSQYPDYRPETIRGLLVHSAEWTPRMNERFVLLHGAHSPNVAKETMLRTVGYGVSNIDRALYSANHALTLIAEGQLQPFVKSDGATHSTDPTLNEMQLHQLPWPIADLQQLPPELEVKLKVTLSYFIEPNPGRRGYRKRYSYQSHGLRFETIRAGQTLENFRAYINKHAVNDDYDGPEGDTDGWLFGSKLNTRGCLHSDIWTGSAAALADMHTIAVFPVGGWWKYRTAPDRWKNSVRYSLLVSIEVPDTDVDIYSTIENSISIQVET
ncbi:MAG: S8 family serine peptidase [Pseudomonadales bacterium]